MIRGLIFDYGGTLDTKAVHWATMIWQAYERQEVPVSYEQFWEAYVHTERMLGRNPIIQKDFTFRKTLETKVEMQLRYLVECGVWSVECGEIVDDLYERVVETTKESAEVLRQLHERYPIAIVSNFYGNLPTVLREFGFDGLYDHLIESAVVGVRKPDPAIFTMGVEALGMQPKEVMAVGDSLEKDILPAREAGCQTVHFAPSLPRSLTLTENPLVIHDLKDLLEIIA